MKKLNFIKTLFYMTFCFCLFSAKTSHAQLTPGDIAIIGVNGDSRVSPVQPFIGTIAIIALVDIPAGTVVKITDNVYNGTAFISASSDGIISWTVSTTVPKGTVFSVSVTNSTSTATIQPSNYGTVTAAGWTNPIVRPISATSGDSWLIYTESTPGTYNFIYGFLNTNFTNPNNPYFDPVTGWGITPPPPTAIGNQTSLLPTQLAGTNAYNTKATYPGGTTLSKHFNSFTLPTSTSGTKEEFLNNIKDPSKWASTDTQTEAKDLTPGTVGGAFSGTQPIYTVTEIPTVKSVTSSPSTGTKGPGSSIAITVKFSENVIVNGSPRIKLNSGSNAYATYTSGSNSTDLIFSYTVATGESSADLDYSSTASLELNGGTIKNALNDLAILTLPATGTASSLGGSSSLVIDALAPTVSSVTAISPNSIYRAGLTIDVNVNFSEAVTVTGTPTLTLNTTTTAGTASYLSGTGTASLTFRYTVGANQNSADLDYATTSSLALAGGTIKDAAGNNAVLNLATPGAAGSLAANANIIIDTTIPTVTGVSGTNGAYNIGSTIPIQIAFTENVVVTGTPQLALSVGLPAGNATYASGSGTSTLTFNYTVAEGQSATDLDYTGTTALSLNGGSISDAAGNNATLTLASPGSPTSLGANSALVINGTRPTISSIVRTGGAAALTKANTVNFTVAFSEAVNGVDITDFVLSYASSLTNLNITSLSGSGTTYTIAVSTGTAAESGGLRLDLKSTGTGIVSLATSNAISGGYTAGQIYTIDRIPPTISPLTISSNNSNTQIAKTGDVVTLSMTASEAVNLPVVTINGNPATVTNSSGLVHNATYTVTAADPEGQITFTVNFSDAAGNAGVQVTSTTNSSKVIVDNVPVTITSVTTSATDGPHGLGTNLPILVTFSEPVTVTGTPRIALNSGGFANYIGGTGSNTLGFTYTVSSGQSSTQLDYSSSAALTLNGGTINDQNAIAAPLTLPAPGGVGSLANGRSIVVNGLIPTALSINRKTPTTQSINASTVEYEITFSEPVDGVDITDFQMVAGSVAGTTLTSVSGSGATYIITLTTGVNNGPFAINLKSTGTGIVNKVLNPIIAGFGPSQIYTIDRVAPTITTATIRSNGAGNGAFAKPAEIVTLSFTADEVITTPVVTISGNSAAVQNTTGNTWVATYTMLATDNNGIIPFNISYSDIAGNAGIAKTTTTNSSTVTYDKTPPTLTSVTIASSNIANPAFAKPGQTVTLNFTASETVSTPVVVVGGFTLAVLPTASPNSYIASYNIASSLPEGEIPFTINFSDQAGNAGTTVTTVTTGSMVTLDKTVPTISNVSISSNNPNPALAKPNDQVTLTFTASEAIQATVLIDGLPATSISNVGNVYTATKTLTLANTEGLLSFSIGSTDLAGNAGVSLSTTNDASTVTFDKTLPVAPNFLGVTPGDTENTLTWFLNADYAKYELIGGTTSPSSNNVLTTVTAANATNPMTFTQTGLTNLTTYYYALRVSDAAGNMNTSARVTGKPLGGQTITFDQPVAAEYGSSFTINATSSSGLPVTLTSNEPTIATVSGNTVTIIGVNPSKSVSIIASQLGNENYLAAAAVIKAVPILPRAVTVTATAQTKVYGAVDPAIATPTVSPALVGTDVSTGTLKRVTGENAGSYEIQQNTYSLDPSKYAITYVPADFTISKKSVTITPQFAYSKTYGQADPAFAYNFTPLVSPDVVTGDLARAAGENVGTYNFDLGTLSAGANYNLVLSPLPQFTINKSVITVTPITASIQYGDAEPVIGYNHTPALKTGDVFTGALARVAGNTPNNYLITQGTLALSNNYTLNFNPTPVNFVVLKKDISITPTAGQGKIYGEADGTINYTASPALLNGDTFSGALSRAPGTAVNNYLIGLGTLAASNPQNYNLQLGTENYAITKKAIQVTATAVSQTYGDADPVSLPYTLSAPLPNGDVFTGKLGRTAGTDVGTYPINLGNLALSAVNYDLSFVPANLSITPKAITITAVSDTKTYGDADPIFGYIGSAVLVSGNSYSGKLGRAPGEDVGSYALTLGDLKVNNNYTLTLNPGATLQIGKKDIAVLADAKSKVYGGTDPELTYTSNPALISGDTFTGALSRAPGEDVNTYVIGKGDLALSSNYNLNYTPANFSIGLQTINVTALAKNKVYGEADPALEYSFTPALKSGDTFTGALSRAAGENVNTYVIGKGDLALSSNYTLNYTPANLTIGLKTIEVTAKAKSKVYGEADPALDYDFSPALKSGDTFTGALSRAPGENVNTYVIGKGDLALNSNYTLNYTPADLTIGLKTINVTAKAKNKVYGESDPVLDYDFIPALKSGDAFTGALSRAPGEAVNTYAIGKGSLALNSNYILNYTPANLTIGQKTINVTAKAKTKVYGEADPAFDYDVVPALQTGDLITGALSRTAGTHVGNYEIGQGNLSLNANYTLAYTPANLSITAKPIAIQINPNSKTYGAPDPQLSYTAPPLESGDVFTGAVTRAPGENKGNYVISKGSLALSSDYIPTYTEGVFLINPAPLTITADPQTKFVGTANPAFTGTYTGFVNGDDVSVLTNKGIFTSTATISSPIGTYPIVPSGAVGSNYLITNVAGVLTVKAGAPTNVLLAATTLYENQAAGAKAGTLSSTADDPNATFTYSLVGGAGDTDNALFRIAGDQLLTTASLDYENKKVYSIRVSSTTQYGFSLDKTFAINLSDVNEIPTLDAIASKTICYTTTGQTIDLTGISAGPESGQNTTLTVTGSNASLLQSLTVASGSGGKGTLSYRVKAGASGISTITVTVKDDGGTDHGGVDTYSRTFVLTVNPLPVIAINANTGSNSTSNSTDVSKGETLVLTASGGSTYVWAVYNSIISGQTSASLTVRPRETTTYTVTVTNASGCSEQKSFTVNVLDDLVKIKATNILTPNGDGYNDKWIIENIDFYPNNEVKIFDKAGRMVYGKRSYDNSWDGMLNGMPLAEGTYYYVIDFGKDRQKFKGFITIVREN